MRPPHLYSVFPDNFAFFFFKLSCCYRGSLYDSVSPDRRLTVRDENGSDDPVVAESDDSTSKEAALSDTREAERLISSRTVCRIIASIAKCYAKMAVLKTTCRTREHGSRERTGDCTVKN